MLKPTNYETYYSPINCINLSHVQFSLVLLKIVTDFVTIAFIKANLALL